MQQWKSSNNSQSFLQNILAQNPYVANLINLSNGNLQPLAQSIAKQKGIDLNQLIQQLQ